MQKNVFECRVGATDWAALKPRLLAAINPATDSVRFYFLDADVTVEPRGQAAGVVAGVTGRGNSGGSAGHHE